MPPPPRYIVPPNQPRSNTGGRGFAGYPGSGNPLAGGAGSGDRNTTTPTPGTYHSDTTFKVGDKVMLLHPCGPTFPAGTIVEIIGIEPTPESATKRPGQDVEWPRTDENSVYRFERKYVGVSEMFVESLEFDPASHFDLVPAPKQTHSPEQYPLRSVLYTVKDMTFFHQSLRNHVRVPRYTSCQVKRWTSRKNGTSGARELIVKKKVERCFYVLQAKYLTYAWEREVCSKKKEVYNFRALRADEMQNYLAQSLPENKVVNWQ